LSKVFAAWDLLPATRRLIALQCPIDSPFCEVLPRLREREREREREADGLIYTAPRVPKDDASADAARRRRKRDNCSTSTVQYVSVVDLSPCMDRNVRSRPQKTCCSCPATTTIQLVMHSTIVPRTSHYTAPGRLSTTTLQTARPSRQQVEERRKNTRKLAAQQVSERKEREKGGGDEGTDRIYKPTYDCT
jgi:hypothetical protein